MVVGSAPLKVRTGVALTSKVVGVLSPGRKVRVTDSRVWRRDGTHRACVAPVDATDGAVSARQILPMGWVTASFLTPEDGSAKEAGAVPGSTPVDLHHYSA
jgi:hypothetical protein